MPKTESLNITWNKMERNEMKCVWVSQWVRIFDKMDTRTHTCTPVRRQQVITRTRRENQCARMYLYLNMNMFQK